MDKQSTMLSLCEAALSSLSELKGELLSVDDDNRAPDSLAVIKAKVLGLKAALEADHLLAKKYRDSPVEVLSSFGINATTQIEMMQMDGLIPSDHNELDAKSCSLCGVTVCGVSTGLKLEPRMFNGQDLLRKVG